MLVEITSEVLRNASGVKFHEGLNVVLGDSAATNSIGKSSLLKIIDFAFGGDTYARHNADAIEELGHHEIQFKIEHQDTIYHFGRSTENPEVVRVIAPTPPNGKSHWAVGEYGTFLKNVYGLTSLQCTFRAIMGVYARMWGKDNANNITRPLNSHSRESGSDAIDTLLKLFERYSQISELEDKLVALNKEIDYLAKAYRGNVIKKLTDKQYAKNTEQIHSIEVEISSIKRELAKYAVSLKQIVNDEVIAAKEEKDELLDQRLVVHSKLTALQKNVLNAKYITSKSFKKLEQFFPGIDLKRVEAVELFHSKISAILKDEMKRSIKSASEELGELDKKLQATDEKISKSLSSISNPGIIVDKTVALIEDYNEKRRENRVYSKAQQLEGDSTAVDRELSQRRSDILHEIAEIINEQLTILSGKAYGDVLHHPILSFHGNDYTFRTPEDTGTGRAYSSVILLDLAMLSLTKLPFLIHDSHLFKNIQNPSIEAIVEEYAGFTKQIFIAMDESGKYGKETADILSNNAVISLSKDATLYRKNWKMRGGQ